MRNDAVSQIGDGLTTIASHMVEIDLQDNLLWCWDEIIKLGVEVPALRALLLHGNKMEALTSQVIDKFPSTCFMNLQVLALNGCNLKSWAEIQTLEIFLPQLQELYIANNQLPDLPRDDADQMFRDATGRECEPQIGKSIFMTLPNQSSSFLKQPLSYISLFLSLVSRNRLQESKSTRPCLLWFGGMESSTSLRTVAKCNRDSSRWQPVVSSTSPRPRNLHLVDSILSRINSHFSMV